MHLTPINTLQHGDDTISLSLNHCQWIPCGEMMIGLNKRKQESEEGEPFVSREREMKGEAGAREPEHPLERRTQRKNHLSCRCAKQITHLYFQGN